MGDGLNKPMIFVRVEKDYKQEAWLNLVMGKALYVDCFNHGMVDAAFPQIAKRISATTSQAVKVPTAVPTSARSNSIVKSAALSGGDTAGGSGELLGLLKTMSAQISEMRADINEVKAGIKQLQADVKSLKN
jgi:hypothetical protein